MNPNQPAPSATLPETKAAAKGWSWPDLVDFEFFLEQDRAEKPVHLEERDHRIYREDIQPFHASVPTGGGQERSWLFRHWLEARRKAFGNRESLPGHLAWGAWRILLKGLAIAGLVSGTGLAANLLRYDGSQPVNVASYLGWLVIIQIGLVLLAGMVVVLRRTQVFRNEFSILSGLVRWLWGWLAARLHRPLISQLPAEQRTRVQSFLGTLAAQQNIYGQGNPWPAMAALQRFGVFFNVGALAVTLALVMFSDRAFGWQSALNVSSGQIHQLVQTLATPWSWALPEAAGPTLAQVEGSKIILKDGIKQLTTQDLVSWWPFLCLALAVYGLLPRIILWMLTGWLGRRALAKLRFEQVACDRLHERLMGPQLHTSGQGPEIQRKDLPLEPLHTPHPGSGAVGSALSENMVLIPQDLLPGLDQTVLMDMIHRRFHWQLTPDQVQTWPNDSGARDEILDTLTAAAQAGPPPRVLLLDEAWQPPIAEKLSSLRDLRQALGSSGKILLALVGRPQDHQLLTPVSSSHWQIWERQISSLGDPQLRLEALCPET